MILSKIKIGKQTKKPIITQRLNIECDDCSKEYESTLFNQLKGFEKYNKDLCRSCRQIIQYKQGLRSEQSKRAGEGAKRILSGITFDELHGIKKSNEIKEKISKKVKGELNPNYGGKYSHGYGNDIWKNILNKNWVERYGEEKANEMKLSLSFHNSRENNNMWGKPSSAGSGNGWSGWYKDWLFRSLLELSYVINVLERFGFNWESAENNKYKIKYVNNFDEQRNYFPDFIVNDKYLIEVKPKKLWEAENVVLKRNAAEIFCKNNNLIYKLTSPAKTLSIEDIKILKERGEIKFTPRYEEKYKHLNN
jgi:hypothetical protein